MKFKPHDYQLYAINYIISHKEAGLFLDMGLGKTIITLTALNHLAQGFEIQKVLVIAPKRVVYTWSTEIGKWDHLNNITYSVVMGTKEERDEALNKKALIYLINRENVQWLVKNHKWDFDTVVIDELSSFKSYSSERFKALKKVRPKVNRIVGLTGTPAPNSLMDLWAQIYLLDMGKRLGKYITHYRQKYFIPDKRNRNVIFSYKLLPGKEEVIYSEIADLCVSMRAIDHLNMPPLISNKVEAVMDDAEWEIYENLRKDMIVELGDKEIDAVSAASLSNKLLQMANGAVYDENKETLELHDKKLDVLEDLIESANGKPVLVAYWFKHDKERLKKRFKCGEINTSKDIDNWNAGKIPIALIHPASAGHGLNLQAGGNIIIWFGLTWSLELYQQLNARLYRQGQKNTVYIFHIIAKNTIDEDVMAALENKDVNQNALIEAVKWRLS